ncbi:MAG: L-aspartate oxidase [Candidatus Saganbacteria bacterium]|nr:L-aspartate oxidase [Candidatus Saganbacteria bacterium]
MEKVTHCDFLIVGGGIAGLQAALILGKVGKTILLTKGKIGESATEKAQGGIAAAIDKIRDSTQFHYEDTLAAGAGLCEEDAVRILVNEGVDRVKDLIQMGARFDRAETEAGGGYSLAMEGAHKRRRILHAGDATGAEIERTLGWNVVSQGKVEVRQKTAGIDLILDDQGKCIGAYALDLVSNIVEIFLAKATILTTGGVCQSYLYTTNPEVATGDGIAMAYRAGAEVTDMEFVQFHPTSLVHSKELEDLIAIPRFLISEAVRGEGAKLLNVHGERFMEQYHDKKELAPRDIVARAIVDQMEKTKSEHVLLDLSGLGAEQIKHRFPVIYKTCLDRGLDITKELLPVAPAAHYFMGGVKTDLNGMTCVPGLYAAGETASLGVHGANRLASNSLLDGLVFGKRAADSAIQYAKDVTLPSSFNKSTPSSSHPGETELKRAKMIIKTGMWNEVGIKRSEETLTKALKKLTTLSDQLNYFPKNREELEIKNMSLVAKLIAQAALDRKESRGAHSRTDFPETDDANWKKHLIYKL